MATPIDKSDMITNVFEKVTTVIHELDESISFKPAKSEAIEKLHTKYKFPNNYKFFLTMFDPKNFIVDPAPFQSLEIYSSKELEQGQIGYSFNSQTNEKIADWDENWLVIANDAGDPFILDLSQIENDDCPVYTASHGEGKWKFRLVASSFVQFMLILMCWMHVHKFFFDEDEGELSKAGKDEFKKYLQEYDPSIANSDEWIYEE